MKKTHVDTQIVEATLPKGWLARGLESARKEMETWPDARRQRLLADQDFPIHPSVDREDK